MSQTATAVEVPSRTPSSGGQMDSQRAETARTARRAALRALPYQARARRPPRLREAVPWPPEGHGVSTVSQLR
jgi:hypothetical protein